MAVKIETDADPLMGYAEIAEYLGTTVVNVRTTHRQTWLGEPDDPAHGPRYRRSTVDARRAGRRGPGRPAKIEHRIEIEGPLTFGGRKGLYQAHCSCGDYVSAPNNEKAARANWQQHADDMTANAKIGEHHAAQDPAQSHQ